MKKDGRTASKQTRKEGVRRVTRPLYMTDDWDSLLLSLSLLARDTATVRAESTIASRPLECFLLDCIAIGSRQIASL